jgi:hypothetical protein
MSQPTMGWLYALKEIEMNDKTLPATLNVEALKTRVQDHITGTFGSLIPDEQMHAMINASIRAFFDTPEDFTFEKVQNNGYGADSYKLKTKITPFQMMVWDIVKPIAQQRLSDYMKEGGGNPLDAFLKEFLGNKDFQDQQVMGTQRLMIAMCVSLFDQTALNSTLNFKSALAQSLERSGYPQIAAAVWSAPA